MRSPVVIAFSIIIEIRCSNLVLVSEATSYSPPYSYSYSYFLILIFIFYQCSFIDVPANILSIYPSSGPKEGGTIITISGNGFAPSPMTLCIFDGEISVETTFISSSELRCQTPTVLLPKVVSVEIRNAGSLQTCSNLHRFEYFGIQRLKFSIEIYSLFYQFF